MFPSGAAPNPKGPFLKYFRTPISPPSFHSIFMECRTVAVHQRLLVNSFMPNAVKAVAALKLEFSIQTV